ncbi:MAG: alpha-glycosidase [Firmicutes bacterium HGW-Firmicutes-1]|nr:MAG: alpha-glycosidase [Firmicutes bacterium HGW-Firmicutes-1]
MQIAFEQLSKTQKILAYVSLREQILDERAIFSDESIQYREPLEPKVNELTKVRIRTAKSNIDEVYLCYSGRRIKIEVEYSDDLFDYYTGTIIPLDKQLEYYFELNVAKLKCYYNKKGVTREPDSFYNFKIVPGFKTPDWAKGAIMYQIFADRFYNGDSTNDVVNNEYMYVGKLAKKVDQWEKIPSTDGIREFYGGDLQGIIDKMDYLQDLGVEVLYLNPIFVSPSNHKYDTQDYDSIDPHLGKIVIDEGDVLNDKKMDNAFATKYMIRTTKKENLDASNELFASLVEEAHKRNMKVILDGVFNHCGSFNKWLDKEKFYENSHEYEMGAFSVADSPYSSFFYFHNKSGWPNNGNYDGWWGYDTLPKLNYEGSPKLYDYILKIAKKWVSPPYNADGWRLDVAADLGYTKEFNHQFWKDFRNAVKTANPEALILAEHYGDPHDWIQGDQWDSVMNYDAFMEPLTWFLTGMEKHSDEFRLDLLGNHRAFFDAMTHNMSRFHYQSLQVAMNELSNHDHSRFLTRTNNKVGRIHTMGSNGASDGINLGVMKEAIVVQMTWPGAPTIYYGDEVGLCGWTDPDNRRAFPWGNENEEILDVHKTLIRFRKEYPCLKSGSIKFLYGENNVISYGRWDKQHEIIIAVNNSKEEKTVKIPVWEIGIRNSDTLEQMFESNVDGFSTEDKLHFVYNEKLILKMMPYSGVILKKKVY